MARTYTLKRRAEQQAETRQRIVEAAIDLHSSVGPAQTTISMVAERAGVQRHTVYAHFPDEKTLLLACSAETNERDPPPDAEAWRAIEDRADRLRVGLSALYDWFGRNADLAGCVLRDAEVHPLTKEIMRLRFGPYIRTQHEVLGEGLKPRERAVLDLALSFFTWRTLVKEVGLSREDAVAAMVQAITTQP